MKKCLAALLEQTYPKEQYEVVVVSDGPDAETEVVVKGIHANGIAVRLIQLDENKGPAAARNAGWLSARGATIAFTDDDCLPDKNWLAEIAVNIDPEKKEAVTGNIVVPRSKHPTDYELNISHLETAEFVTANCACTRAALIATGGFDERFRMAWREDSDLHFKLISQDIPVTYLSSATVVHPVRDPQWGISVKEQKKTLFNALLYQKYPKLYRDRIQPLPPVLYYFIIAAFAVMLTGLFGGDIRLFKTGATGWVLLTLYFTFQRLRQTSRGISHVVEMACTSFVIPFLSVYWQWYGAFRYRVFFI